MNVPDNRNADVVAALLAGARTFREREYGAGSGRMRTLAAGQRPGAIMIACADSRVDPALLFDTRPGDLLVVRTVANLVPPPDANGLGTGIMAAMELGLKTLRIPHLIVCGHSDCAGVRIALNGALQEREESEPQDSGDSASMASARRPPSASERYSGQGAPVEHNEMARASAPYGVCLRAWATVAAPACREIIAEHGAGSVDELARRAGQRSVLASLDSLRAHLWLRELESRCELTLHGWWFDIASGELWAASPDTGDFVRV